MGNATLRGQINEKSGSMPHFLAGIPDREGIGDGDVHVVTLVPSSGSMPTVLSRRV